MQAKNLLALADCSLDRPRTQLVHDSANLRLVLICLKAGQEMAPHESNSEVLLQTLRGEGTYLIGEIELSASTGSLAVCPPHQPHGIRAEKDMVVLVVISPRPE